MKANFIWDPTNLLINPVVEGENYHRVKLKIITVFIIDININQDYTKKLCVSLLKVLVNIHRANLKETIMIKKRKDNYTTIVTLICSVTNIVKVVVSGHLKVFLLDTFYYNDAYAFLS